MAPLPRPQQGTAADDDSMGLQQRKFDSVDGARPKKGMNLRCKYVILAPEELVGGPATAGPWVKGTGHGATRGTEDQGQRALLARGIQELVNKEQIPPNGCAHLTYTATKGGEDGGGGSTGSACLRCAARGRRGTPRHGSARPDRAAA